MATVNCSPNSRPSLRILRTALHCLSPKIVLTALTLIVSTGRVGALDRIPEAKIVAEIQDHLYHAISLSTVKFRLTVSDGVATL